MSALETTNFEQFTEQGYLVMKSVISEVDLAPFIAVISEVVDNRATELYAEGAISDTYADMPFERRWYAPS